MHDEPDLSGPPDAAFIAAVAAAAATDDGATEPSSSSRSLTRAPALAPLRPSITRRARRPTILPFLLLGGAALLTYTTIAPFRAQRFHDSLARIEHEIFSAAGAISASLLAAGGLILLSMAIRPRRSHDPVALTAWLLAAVGGALVVLAPMRLPRELHHGPILAPAALIAGTILLAVGVVIAAQRRRAGGSATG